MHSETTVRTVQSATLALLALTEAHRTPFYVYDLGILSDQCKDFQAAFPYPWFRLYFATMANDRTAVLETLARLGLGACVNSIPHLELALRSGFPTEKVQLSSTGVSKEDMKRLLSLDVRLNADSIKQAEQWRALGGESVGLRINAASLSNDRPKDRIGMSLDEVDATRSMARDQGLRISALHVYIGTNLPSHEQLLPTVERLFLLAERFENLECINIGGGIGVNYGHEGPDFDLKAYGNGIAKYHQRLSRMLGLNVSVIVEPGRKLTAECGKMITRVTDVKSLHGRRYVTVDASIAVFPRPFHHPDSPHHIWQLSTKKTTETFPWSEAVVVGRTTFSKDILGLAMLSDAVDVDDVLVFDDAGSYSQSMETRFLGQPTPESVVINEDDL